MSDIIERVVDASDPRVEYISAETLSMEREGIPNARSIAERAAEVQFGDVHGIPVDWNRYHHL